MAILPVPSYRNTPGYCGPSCLRMIFAYHGIRTSEVAIARVARATRAHGASEKQIAAAARHYGFHAQVKDHSTLKDLAKHLKSGHPVIVDWFSIDEGHYSVVIGMDRTHVLLRDPQRIGLTRIKKQVFKKVWFDFKEKVPLSKQSLITRRMILIEKKKKRIA